VLKRLNRIIVGLLLTSDVIATALAFNAAYYIRFYSGIIPQPVEIPPLTQYFKILPLVLALIPAVFAINGLYKSRRGRSRIDEFFSIFVSCALSTLIIFLILLYFRVYHTPDVSPEWEFSRITLVFFLGIDIVFVAGLRFVIRNILDALQRRGFNQHNILIAGAGELGRTLVDRIVTHEEFGLRAIGFLDDDDRKRGSVYQGVRVVGSLKDLHEIIHERRVHTLFVALPAEAYRKTLQLVDVATKHCIEVRVVPDLLQFLNLKATVEDFDGLPIINVDQTPLHGINRVVKRTFDIIMSIIGLAITAVTFPFIFLAIRLSSPGPIFFRQERMGIDGRPFTLYKFRTMSVNAEVDKPVWATLDDPRATRVGRLLRRTSLDELPQFWNVLRGEMSLVGPRPERPEFVREFKHHVPNYMLRHKVKAGMTGWAQVNGWRGDTSIEKRIEYDLYYIQNWSMALDLKIIWLTISRSMFGRSHY
jgi:Undecaprenyl-phosphate glucose phosphotransferase